MKPFLALLGLLLFLSFMKTRADDWSAIRLQCANHWFYLRIKATLFPNIFMEPDEVFLGFGCPVTTVWPNDIYEFTYRTNSCGIVNKVLCGVTLLQTQLTYISKNASLRAKMSLSCVLHSVSTSSEGHQVSNEPQASETSSSEAAEVPSFMDQNFSVFHFSRMQVVW
ncbi:oocyte-secreted protein 1-like [Mus pahari]|uniref:oocyte-secreted protein 1-like n=1 Tax=Mus pahari TaxID=10093 RepID=UPI000A30B7D9|nr:oocyte-secreted protein 1-like [Mus pahari]